MTPDILAALAAERLTNPWWTRKPEPRDCGAPDDELTCRRRLAALVAEAEGTPDPRRATA